MLSQVAERFGLSARGYHRVLRVARTIADLDGSREVRRPHVAEAVSYRLSLAVRDVIQHATCTSVDRASGRKL